MWFVTLTVYNTKKEHFIFLSDVFKILYILNQITDISRHRKGHLFLGSAQWQISLSKMKNLSLWVSFRCLSILDFLEYSWSSQFTIMPNVNVPACYLTCNLCDNGWSHYLLSTVVPCGILWQCHWLFSLLCNLTAPHYKPITPAITNSYSFRIIQKTVKKAM